MTTVEKCRACSHHHVLGDCDAVPEDYKACLIEMGILPTPEEARAAEMETKQERIELGCCPDCDPTVYLLNVSGCKHCPQCGWSACD